MLKSLLTMTMVATHIAACSPKVDPVDLPLPGDRNAPPGDTRGDNNTGPDDNMGDVVGGDVNRGDNNRGDNNLGDTLSSDTFVAADSNMGDNAPRRWNLSFDGGTSYNTAHGGQTYGMKVVDLAGPTVVDSTTGMVPGGLWTVTFTDALEDGESYELRLWIDSGGGMGACEGPPTDHQWAFTTGVVTTHVILTETHSTMNFTNVCGTPFP